MTERQPRSKINEPTEREQADTAEDYNATIINFRIEYGTPGSLPRGVVELLHDDGRTVAHSARLPVGEDVPSSGELAGIASLLDITEELLVKQVAYGWAPMPKSENARLFESCNLLRSNVRARIVERSGSFDLVAIARPTREHGGSSNE